jgi:hypothetical protein
MVQGINLKLVDKIQSQGNQVQSPPPQNAGGTSGSIFNDVKVSGGAKKEISGSDNNYATSLFNEKNGKQELSELGGLANKLDGKEDKLSGKDLKSFNAAAQQFDKNGDGKLGDDEKKGLVDFLKDKLGITKEEATKKAEDPSATANMQAQQPKEGGNDIFSSLKNALGGIVKGDATNAAQSSDKANGLNKDNQKQEEPKIVADARHLGKEDYSKHVPKKTGQEVLSILSRPDKDGHKPEASEIKQNMEKIVKAYDHGYKSGGEDHKAQDESSNKGGEEKITQTESSNKSSEEKNPFEKKAA